MWKNKCCFQSSGKEEAKRHGRIEVRPGDFSDGIDHGHHDESESEGDTDMCHRAAAHAINDDRTRTGEDESKGADGLGKQETERGHEVREIGTQRISAITDI